MCRNIFAATVVGSGRPMVFARGAENGLKSATNHFRIVVMRGVADGGNNSPAGEMSSVGYSQEFHDIEERQALMHHHENIRANLRSRMKSRGGSRTEYKATEVTQQHFGGALATLVFGAALLSERLNGVGIVQNLELHNKGFHPVLLGAIALLLCASAWPEKRESENPGLLVRIQMAGARVAYIGLASAIAAEMFTGKGVLALLDIETGVEAFSDVEAVMIFLTMLVLTGPHYREIE